MKLKKKQYYITVNLLCVPGSFGLKSGFTIGAVDVNKDQADKIAKILYSTFNNVTVESVEEL